MEIQQIIEIIGIAIGSLGVLVAGMGYAMGQFTQGRNNRRKDDTEVKKDAFDLMQAQVKSLEELCGKQQKEITILQTQAEERERKAKEYVDIFQNRNPDMLVFMKYMTETANFANSYMKDTGLTLTGLKDLLEEMTENLHELNKKINNPKGVL